MADVHIPHDNRRLISRHTNTLLPSHGQPSRTAMAHGYTRADTAHKQLPVVTASPDSAVSPCCIHRPSTPKVKHSHMHISISHHSLHPCKGRQTHAQGTIELVCVNVQRSAAMAQAHTGRRAARKQCCSPHCISQRKHRPSPYSTSHPASPHTYSKAVNRLSSRGNSPLNAFVSSTRVLS